MKDLVVEVVGVVISTALAIACVILFIAVSVICVTDIVNCPEHMLQHRLTLSVGIVLVVLMMAAAAIVALCVEWRNAREEIAKIKARKL